MKDQEHIAGLISKFMKAQPEIDRVEIRPVLHITSYEKAGLSLDARVRIYDREVELIKYLKKLGAKVSIDFRVISNEE